MNFYIKTFCRGIIVWIRLLHNTLVRARVTQLRMTFRPRRVHDKAKQHHYINVIQQRQLYRAEPHVKVGFLTGAEHSLGIV